MKLLAKFVVGEKTLKAKVFERRTAVRAVLFNEKGEVAIVENTKDSFPKITGGGVERGESLKQALKRELREEGGCIKFKILGEVGKIVEDRLYTINQIQTSYCFKALAIKYSKAEFDEKEQKQGFTLTWMKPDDAIRKFQAAKPKTLLGEYMSKRDLLFLKTALELKN